MLGFLSIDVGSLLFTLCNTLILFLVIRHFLFKPVVHILEARQQEVDETYQKADDAKARADKLETDYSTLMGNAKTESAEMMKAATKRAQSRSDAMLEDAKQEANAIMQRANDEILLEQQRAVAQMRGEIADLAVQVAEKVVARDLNASDHDRMISDFIDQLGTAE